MNEEYQSFFIRIFIEPKDTSEIEAIVSKLHERLERHGVVNLKVCQPYRKIESYIELLFAIERCTHKAAFQNLMAEIGSGWEMLGEDEAVWNVEEEALSTTTLRWASIGLRQTN